MKVRRTLLSDVSIIAVAQKLQQSLIVLDLSLCENITTESIQALYTNCPSLQKLYLSWIASCSDDDVHNLLYSCRNLKSLRLEGCKLVSYKVCNITF